MIHDSAIAFTAGLWLGVFVMLILNHLDSSKRERRWLEDRKRHNKLPSPREPDRAEPDRSDPDWWKKC